MADEYIKRGDAINAVGKWLWDIYGIKESDGTATIFKKLRSIPAEDVVPVKHGKWEEGNQPSYNSDWYFRKCSVCGYKRGDCDPCLDTNFCQNCGADMRGAE